LPRLSADAVAWHHPSTAAPDRLVRHIRPWTAGAAGFAVLSLHDLQEYAL